MEDVQGPLSQLIVTFFKERFPALSADPAITGLLIGLILGAVVTWFIYWVAHRNKITGLEAKIHGLEGVRDVLHQEKSWLERQLKAQPEKPAPLEVELPGYKRVNDPITKSPENVTYDDPQVIITSHLEGLLQKLVVSNIGGAPAFNIKSDRIQNYPVSAVLETISQLAPAEKVTPRFLILDERYQAEMGETPTQWLHVILDEKTPAVFSIKLRYHNASGQMFQSELVVQWDAKREQMHISPKQIIRVPTG